MKRSADILRFLLSLGIVLVVVFISTLFFTKFDLTEEKRHTLTDPTIEMLQSLDNQLIVRVFLHGEFPAEFKRLEQAVREKLDEFRDHSNGHLSYEFVDIYESGDDATIQEMRNRLFEEGLEPTTRSQPKNGSISAYEIWPGALISYSGKVFPVQLLKSDGPTSKDQMINNSLNDLEYELARSIRKVQESRPDRIAFLSGHNESTQMELTDIGLALDKEHNVSFVEIDGKLDALTEKIEGKTGRVSKYELLIVANPKSDFNDKDKVIIDQFMMNGGKVIWMVDPIEFSLDSLRKNQFANGTFRDFNLSDMFFEYGVRLNRTLVLDRSCIKIDLGAGKMGNQENYELQPWYYNPLVLSSDSAHPVINNLDPISLEFASSLDTVNSNIRVKKSVLLQSSKYSKALKAPVRIDPSIVAIDPNFGASNQPYQMIAVLMEGIFPSAYADRINDSLRTNVDFAFQSESKATKMLVIADGDIAKNKVINTPNGPMVRPLGFDMNQRAVMYDNKEFMLNAVDYMLDDTGLIEVRSRTIKLRKLNEEWILNDKSRWQIINIALPLMLVVIFGLIQWYLRKKRFGAQPPSK